MPRFVAVVGMVALGAGAVAGGAAAANSPAAVNGTQRAAAHTPLKAARCSIYDDSGSPVSVVNIDEETGSDQVYWIGYNGFSAGSSEKISIKGPSGDLFSETQVLAGYTGGGILPFGIPFWASNQTSGKYKVRVQAIGGPSVGCSFTTNP